MLATVGLILVRHSRWRAEYCRGPHPPTVFGYHVTWSTGTMFLFGIVVGAVALLEPIVLVAGTPSLARRRHDVRTAPAPSNGQSWSSTGASTPLAAPKLEHHCVPESTTSKTSSPRRNCFIVTASLMAACRGRSSRETCDNGRTLRKRRPQCLIRVVHCPDPPGLR